MTCLWFKWGKTWTKLKNILEKLICESVTDVIFFADREVVVKNKDLPFSPQVPPSGQFSFCQVRCKFWDLNHHFENKKLIRKIHTNNVKSIDQTDRRGSTSRVESGWRNGFI